METPQHWTIEENKLTRIFEFANFVEAVAFVNKIVPLTEGSKHHPDIEIFAYKKVKVKLSSHDVGDIESIKNIKKRINENPPARLTGNKKINSEDR